MSTVLGRRLFRDLAAVSGANAIAIVASAGVSMMMPLALNLDGYAYWQLFSLYSSFAGFFPLGFNDGVFQRYAHREYKAELVELLARMRWVVVILGLIGGLAVLSSCLLFPAQKQFAVIATAMCIVFFGLNGFLTYANQLAGRYTVVATSILVERVSLLLGSLVLLLVGERDYRIFVLASVASSLLKLGYLCLTTRAIAFSRHRLSRQLLPEIRANFTVGFPVMLAILLGGSILVPSRLVVESQLGSSAFALYSFALTAVLITGTILSSLAQSLFPLLRKLDRKQFAISIGRSHRMLTLAASVLLLSYFVAAVLIEFAYPKFASSLDFLGVLFPLFIFQSKYLILLVTILRIRDRVGRLLIVAASGMLANLLIALAVAALTGSVLWIALGVVATYIVWLQAWWTRTAKVEGIRWTAWDTFEIALTVYFLGCLVLPKLLALPNGWELLTSALAYILGLGIVILIGRRWLWAAIAPEVARRRQRSVVH